MKSSLIAAIITPLITGLILTSTSLATDEELSDIQKKAGRLIISGFEGKSPHEESVQEICSLLKKGYIGGVYLREQNIVNPSQLKELTQTFHEAAEDIFVVIDYEGGDYTPLKVEKGFLQIPSPATVAKSLTSSEAFVTYCGMAGMLKDHGINLNLAPLVELNKKNSKAQRLHERSYSSEPKIVIQYADQFINAHKKENILACIKYFPGNGFSRKNSNENVLDITMTAQPHKELDPYYEIMCKHSGEIMIMTAHVINRNLDNSSLPTTLSAKIIPEHLRQKTYDGVIISSDLCARSLHRFNATDIAYRAFFNASHDLLLYSQTHTGKIDEGEIVNLPDARVITKEFEAYAKESKTNKKRIKESYRRVKKIKAQLSSKE